MNALARSLNPFDKPFGQWYCHDIVAPAEDASKAISEIMALAPAADRNIVLAANMAVLSRLFKNPRARLLIQLAIEVER